VAKIILKSPYLKPNASKHLSNLVKYIATREGVEKPNDTKRNFSATQTQQKVITELLKQYPDSIELFEFEDYEKNHTRENADEYILRVAENHGELFGTRQKYVDYIATRPKVQKIAEHGMFSDDGIPVVLAQVAKEVSEHQGNVWTHIISLRREDAERLGYNSVSQWQSLLQSQRNTIAKYMQIDPKNFRWYAAFHNADHHPHVHMIAYSVEPKEAYLTEHGIREIKASLAKEIFRQDLISIYDEQTKYRDSLRQDSHKTIADIVEQINNSTYNNPQIEKLLLQLSERLKNTSGKKVYGYLKVDVKSIIDTIIDELAKDENISKLYDLWYEKRFEILKTYTDNMPDKLPLSQQKEFKAIKNAVIAEVLKVNDDKITFEDDNFQDDIPISEPTDAEAETVIYKKAYTNAHGPEFDYILKEAQDGNKYSQYRLAKFYMDKKSEHYDMYQAVDWLIKSAQQNYTVAQYMLGKLFLKGDSVIKDIPYAFRWLELAEEQNNHYAQYLLGKTHLIGEDAPRDVEQAIELVTKSANQGNRYAQYSLGKLYLNDDDIPRDIEKAIDLLNQSATKDFEAAQYLLGKLFLKGELMQKDIPRAVKYLTLAAEKGNQFAQYMLGKLYLIGEDVPKDINSAFKFLSQSADQGNQYALYTLGKLYLYGTDVKYEREQAMKLLTASAEQGNVYAVNLLKSMQKHNNASTAIGTLNLLYQMSKIIKNKLEDDRKGKLGVIDRKLKREIDEKKQAHGLRQ
jgi:TPR repeat protein/rRNA-processing protein FCF1